VAISTGERSYCAHSCHPRDFYEVEMSAPWFLAWASNDEEAVRILLDSAPESLYQINPPWDRSTTRENGKTSVAAKRINKKKYGALLATARPAVIKIEEENERMLSLAEQLIDKGKSRTPEEDQLFELVTRLIEDFEEEHYPIPDAPPHRILRFLMEQNDLRQSDLLPIFGSRGYVFDVVNGKRTISKTHAKALGKMFHVSPDVFI